VKNFTIKLVGENHSVSVAAHTARELVAAFFSHDLDSGGAHRMSVNYVQNRVHFKMWSWDYITDFAAMRKLRDELKHEQALADEKAAFLKSEANKEQKRARAKAVSMMYAHDYMADMPLVAPKPRDYHAIGIDLAYKRSPPPTFIQASAWFEDAMFSRMRKLSNIPIQTRCTLRPIPDVFMPGDVVRFKHKSSLEFTVIELLGEDMVEVAYVDGEGDPAECTIHTVALKRVPNTTPITIGVRV